MAFSCNQLCYIMLYIAINSFVYVYMACFITFLWFYLFSWYTGTFLGSVQRWWASKLLQVSVRIQNAKNGNQMHNPRNNRSITC